jgi:hypothetical protein
MEPEGTGGGGGRAMIEPDFSSGPEILAYYLDHMTRLSVTGRRRSAWMLARQFVRKYRGMYPSLADSMQDHIDDSGLKPSILTEETER